MDIRRVLSRSLRRLSSFTSSTLFPFMTSRMFWASASFNDERRHKVKNRNFFFSILSFFFFWRKSKKYVYPEKNSLTTHSKSINRNTQNVFYKQSCKLELEDRSIFFDVVPFTSKFFLLKLKLPARKKTLLLFCEKML